MQMGRWFGYRDNYEDLCRVYMSEASFGWYCHIAEATEELRMQIKRMRREGRKPIDFGLYVRAHPDTLIVTAMNKMYHAESRVLRVSYDGSLRETYIIPESATKTRRNRELFNSFYKDIQNLAEPYKDTTNSSLFRDISWEKIQNFVLEFNFHDDMLDLKENLPRFIKEIADLYPVWDVVFKSLATKQPEAGHIIAAQVRSIGYEPSDNPRKPTSEPGWYTGNKFRFSGNDMFKIGLDEAQLAEAQKNADESKRKKPIVSDYTNARGKPLLMLHLLNLVDKENELVIDCAPAISVSFPNSSEFRTVEYVVGKVWLKQFEQEHFDSPDEEDDYDLEQ